MSILYSFIQIDNEGIFEILKLLAKEKLVILFMI